MGRKEDLESIVGGQNVITGGQELAGYKSASGFYPGERPDFIVRPGNIDQIKSLIGLANGQRFALVPCSSNGRHSRGASSPGVEGAVIVDMTGMKSIIRVDRRNKVAMVEPGVTFGELQAAVEKEGLRIEMPLIPRKDKSVLASLLDREPTTGPKYNWDATDPLGCIELVFGTGDVFRTGNSAGPGSLEQQWASGQAQKMPMGPAQTDIARLIQGSQGTFGIATWATIKLELMPAIKKGFIVSGQSPDKLIDFAYRILWRKIPDLCLILNGTNLAHIFGKAGGEFPEWSLIYSISAFEHFPEERIDYLEKDLAEIAQSYGVEPAQSVAGLSANSVVETLSRPGDEPHWKIRARGACRDLFFLTTLDKTPGFVSAVMDAAAKCDYPEKNVGVYIQPIRHGTGCHLEFSLMYDPENAGEKEKIGRLYEDAARKCLEMGAFFSRPYPPLAELVYKNCPETAGVLRKLKDIFDPNGILNPGKLCFGKEA